MTEVDYYLALLTDFGYKISKQTVERMIEKFKSNPDAKAVGGPELFIKGWMSKEENED